MDPAIWIEIFGYIGTALVIVSMLMTSVVKLRIVNMCGALISMIYAIIVVAWPIVVMNAALIVIQLVQLGLLYRKKKREPAATGDSTAPTEERKPEQ